MDLHESNQEFLDEYKKARDEYIKFLDICLDYNLDRNNPLVRLLYK